LIKIDIFVKNNLPKTIHLKSYNKYYGIIDQSVKMSSRVNRYITVHYYHTRSLYIDVHCLCKYIYNYVNLNYYITSRTYNGCTHWCPEQTIILFLLLIYQQTYYSFHFIIDNNDADVWTITILFVHIAQYYTIIIIIII